MSTKQLYEKTSEGMKEVSPLVAIEDIYSKLSDTPLEALVSLYNHVKCEWKGSVADTRRTVPLFLRRSGLFITYNNGTKYITEFFSAGTDQITTEGWVKDSNWTPVPDEDYISAGVKPGVGTIGYEQLSDNLKQLFREKVNVTNFPDDEDIASVDNMLKFKDREVNSANFQSKGYIIIRKNLRLVNGVVKNILTQNMINKPNTIYEIRYDFDLNGETIEVQEGCTLKFEGGSLKNGKIIGNETKLENLYKSFYNIKLENTYADVINEFTIDRNLFKDDVSYLAQLISIPCGKLIFTTSYEFTISISSYFALNFKSNSNIDFSNSTFSLVANNLSNYAIFNIAGVHNVKISNFSIIGDVRTHIGDSGEWGHGIHISNSSENIVINNANIHECWGDGIDIIEYEHSNEELIGPPRNILIDSCKCYRNRRQGISIESGQNIRILNSEFRYTGEIKFTSPGSGLDIEPFSYKNKYFVQNIIIQNCVITDNVKNSNIENKAEVKILANTNTDVHFGYNNITIDSCILGYTEIKDTYGVLLKNSKCESVTCYNGDTLDVLNNEIKLFFIQEWLRANIRENLIDSKDNIGIGWRPTTTFTVLGNKVSGIIKDNIINSYTKEPIIIGSSIDFISNTVYNYSIDDLKSTNINWESIGKILNNTFFIGTTINIVIPHRDNDLSPIISNNVFIDTNMTINISHPLSSGYDISIINNYTDRSYLYNVISAVGSIYAFGNNKKTTNRTIHGNGEIIVSKDNEIPRIIISDGVNLFPIGLVDAIRNASAFYNSHLEGRSKTICNGYANDIEIPVFWNGTSWVGYDGKDAKARFGTTLSRPILENKTKNKGYLYFDTDLNKLICWNGIAWVNVDGTELT